MVTEVLSFFLFEMVKGCFELGGFSQVVVIGSSVIDNER